tara:strand:+ start:409 stop:1095 length:687 start_codon:yes stop_codon:yes gene_type:complete
MKNELKKRIVTSIFLISLISLCLYIGHPLILILFFIVSYIAYNEFTKLLDATYGSSLGINVLRRSLTLFYCFFIFWIPIASFATDYLYDFIFILSICIFSDIGGFIVGKTIKGPKLIKISPNKTISGSIGSICFSFIPLIILNYFLPDIFLFSKANLLFCIEITIVCQLGDLFISFFKRKAKVKDTGKILPGHGGLLDRIDGMIFALPYAYNKLYGINNYLNLSIFNF